MDDFTTSDVFFRHAAPVVAVWPYCVAAAGRTCVGPQDGVVRRQYHDHTLILTLEGQGRIEVGCSSFMSHPGDVVWLDTSKTYQHGAQSGDMWRYLWLGLSGFGLAQLHVMMGLQAQPVITDMAHLRVHFQEIIAVLEGQHPSGETRMTAQFAQILAALYCRRDPSDADIGSDPISKVMRHLRKDLSGKWEIADVADIAGLSPSQLFRRFKAVSGVTPKSWLRRERMVLARHLLVATNDDIAGTALRCGYADPFHFSRDFARENGVSPRQFRRDARG